MGPCSRLCVLALLLFPWLPSAFLSSAPAPSLKPRNEEVRRPIKAAYERIRIGMTQRELLKLMAPFKSMNTGHGQWPCWTDGKFSVHCTVWTDGDFLAGTGTWRVQEKGLSKVGGSWQERNSHE